MAAISCYHSLTNKLQHIENIIQKQVSKQVARNHLRVMTTTQVVKFFTLQGCALRGRDESKGSSNRGNVIEMVSLLASYNVDVDVDAAVLGNAPKNATYVSPLIQKQILSILAHKTQKYIRWEIGDGKFCLLVDEARDESKREQMAIVLRFVDKDGFIQEHFFDIVHVKDTASATLKDEICKVLSRHDLDVHNIRGQGYDGTSNMRGERAGLQAMFSKECPFAYYVHCFAHRLQLALVAVAKDVKDVWQIFSNLTLIVNIVGASCKRSDQLRDAKAAEIAEKLASTCTENDELDSKGKNHIQTLKRARDTRWGSHLGSISSLMSMYSATLTVLTYIVEDGATSNMRAEADGAYDTMTTFEFVFVLHLMKEIMEITDDFCQALQRKSQEILNAMHLVSTTKTLIHNLRENGWVPLLEKVKLFCRDHGIDIIDMGSVYTGSRGRRSRSQKGTRNDYEHHFRVQIFIGTIDSQLQELNHRFQEDVIELLILSSALNPRDGFKSFKAGDICKLANKFYPMDFTEQEKIHLGFQFQNYKLDVLVHLEFQKLSTVSKLFQMLAKTKKSIIYPLIDRLVRLVLTLPVSTATSERAFSAMKIIKTRLRNRMENDFLAYSMIVYIEKDIARSFDMDSIIDAFDNMVEGRRVQLQMLNLSTIPLREEA